MPLDPSPIYVEEPDAEPAPAGAGPSHASACQPPPAPRVAPPPLPANGSPGVGVSEPAASGSQPAPSAKEAGPAGVPETGGAAVRVSVVCPGCGARYAAHAGSVPRTARCRKCQATITIPSAPAAP